MKKIGLLLALMAFIGCLFAGYGMMSIYEGRKTGPSPTLSAPAEGTRQQNLFLIHVDRLKSPDSALISVWIIFLYYADTPSMMFKPLITAEDPGSRDPRLIDAFQINPDGTLSDEFVARLKSTYNVQVDGYLLLDDQALISFASRFPEAPLGSHPAPTSGEQSILYNLCSYLQLPEARDGVELPWSEVLPDHFDTDLNFSSFMSNWLRLTQGANPPLCEIVTS